MKKVIINVAKESDEQDRYIENGGYGMYDISFQINLNDKKFKEILLNKSEWIKNKKYDIGMRIDLGDEYDCIEEEYNYIIDNNKYFISERTCSPWIRQNFSCSKKKQPISVSASLKRYMLLLPDIRAARCQSPTFSLICISRR